MIKFSNARNQISSIKKNQFLSGSLVMVLGFNLSNFGQALYHFIFARLLGKVYYGDLATIITIAGIIGVIQMSFGLTIVRQIASSKSESKSSNFIKWIFLWSIIIGLAIGIVTEILAPFLSGFLKISQPEAVYLLGPLLFFFFIANSNRSILQGLLKFKSFVLSLITETFSKVLITLILVSLGFKLFGAMIGFLISIILSCLVTIYAIRSYIKGKRDKPPAIGPLFKYSGAVLLQGLALTSMYSTDLLLVKHFLTPLQAGLYASMAIMGRIVFFGTTPITNVMFPMVAKKHSNNESYHKIFYLSLLLVVSVALLITLFYFLLPKIAIMLLVGPEYFDGAAILWWFGISMTLLSLAMLLTQFFLSIGHTKVVSLFVMAAILQIILIWFNHQALLTVIQMSIISVSLLDLCLFVYFLRRVR